MDEQEIMTPISGTVGFVKTASASNSLFEESLVFGRLENNLVMDGCDPSSARFPIPEELHSRRWVFKQSHAEIAGDLKRRVDQSQGTLTNV